MRRLASIGAALLLAAAAPAQKVEDLKWLGGAWAGESGGRWTEEWWTPPRGGIMIGANFSGKGERADSFEHMRIMPDKEGKLVFYAMPGGAPAVAFPLVKGGASEAVFENPGHDYPQRIIYRLEGETLTASISLIDGSREHRWTFKRR